MGPQNRAETRVGCYSGTKQMSSERNGANFVWNEFGAAQQSQRVWSEGAVALAFGPSGNRLKFYRVRRNAQEKRRKRRVLQEMSTVSIAVVGDVSGLQWLKRRARADPFEKKRTALARRASFARVSARWAEARRGRARKAVARAQFFLLSRRTVAPGRGAG